MPLPTFTGEWFADCSAAERGGYTLECFRDFQLTAVTRFWSSMSYVRRVDSTRRGTSMICYHRSLPAGAQMAGGGSLRLKRSAKLRPPRPQGQSTFFYRFQGSGVAVERDGSGPEGRASRPHCPPCAAHFAQCCFAPPPRAKREQFKTASSLEPDSQGQKLALTVLSDDCLIF